MNIKHRIALILAIQCLCVTLLSTQVFAKQVYAVIVGLNTYSVCDASGKSNLNYCVKDAQSFAGLLLDMGVPKSNIHLLTEEKATSTNIMNALNSTFRKATEEDRVIFFFSGHGMPDFFITYDCMKNLSHSDLKASFKASRSKDKLCFADACFSGSLKAFGGSVASPITEDGIEKNFKGFKSPNVNVAVFISSRADQTSMEAPWLGNGAFTHFLLKGLRGEADANKDRQLTINELYQFVSSNVKRETNNSQIPVIFGQFSKNKVLVKFK